MCCQDCPQSFGARTLFGLEVTAHGNHTRGWCGTGEMLDELELPFWIESDLQGDDAVGLPVASLGLRGRERLRLDAQAPRGHPDALREK
jgi:hypothetical protein